MSPSSSKIVQLNIPVSEELKMELKRAAANNNRKLNAEVQQRLQDSFLINEEQRLEMLKEIKKIISPNSKSSYQIKISKKLKKALDLVSGRFKTVTPSKIAGVLGHTDAEMVHMWFDGEKTPSFDELKMIANAININSEWLLYDIGFPLKVSELLGEQGFENLIENITSNFNFDDIKHMYIVRSTSAKGEICFISVYNNSSFSIYKTNIKLSNKTAGIDSKNRVEALKIFRAMHSSRWHDKIEAHLLEPKKFASIVSGNANVLCIIEELRPSNWSNEIGTEYVDTSYWDDWDLLNLSLRDNLNYNHDAMNDIESINSRIHPIIDRLNSTP